VRAEGAGVAFQIAERYVKSTKYSLNQLQEDCKDHGRPHGSLHDEVERPTSDCIYESYRELLQRYTDLCVIQDALWIAKKEVSKNRSGESRESGISVKLWRWLSR
jgi:hypothetical protein